MLVTWANRQASTGVKEGHDLKAASQKHWLRCIPSASHQDRLLCRGSAPGNGAQLTHDPPAED